MLTRILCHNLNCTEIKWVRKVFIKELSLSSKRSHWCWYERRKILYSSLSCCWVCMRRMWDYKKKVDVGIRKLFSMSKWKENVVKSNFPSEVWSGKMLLCSEAFYDEENVKIDARQHEKRGTSLVIKNKEENYDMRKCFLSKYETGIFIEQHTEMIFWNKIFWLLW